MDNELNAPLENSSALAIVKRYEDMLMSKRSYFFDVDEFEEIIQHYNEKNESAKVLDVIEYAFELHPNNASLLVHCAQLYLSIHKPQEALRYLNMAESFEPFNIDLFYTKGNIFTQLRKPEKAVEQYRKALNHADAAEREDIALQLAFELENLNKYTEAIDCLKKILLWNPDNDTALYEIGFCFDASQQIAEGREFFQGFVDLHPYSYIGWYNLGINEW